MRFKTAVLGPNLRSHLISLFIVSILYGDVWLGMTVPLSMLVLPIVFLAYAKAGTFSNIPPGCTLLLAMVVPVAFQFALGRPLNGKPDVVVYLPIVYAAATIFVLQSAALTDKALWRALTVGGVVTAVVMVLMVSFIPAGKFLVPGQNFYATVTTYERSLDEKARTQQSGTQRTPTMTPEELGLQNSEFEVGFYALKRSIKNALGISNYISAFFVFLFTVSLFHQQRFAVALFALLTVATLSRFGVIFLGLAVGVWLLHRRRVNPVTLAVGALGSGVLVMLVVLFVARQFDSLLPTSVSNRSVYWESAVDVIAAHPVVGAPRSHILEEFDRNIIWNPHSVLLWVTSIAGFLGLTFYLLYLFVGLAEIHHRISYSSVWTGVFFGFVILLTWSLIEPVAMTPAFEVLFASLYALARNHVVMPAAALRTMSPLAPVNA